MEKVLSQYNLVKKNIITKRGIMGGVTAFLLGRAVIFDIISPFGLAYLAAYVSKNPTKAIQSVLVAAVALIGSLCAGLDILFVKYMLAFVLFGLIYIAVTTLTDSRRNFTTSAIAAISIGISGIIFSAQTGFAAYELLMLGVECSACFVSTLIMTHALPIIYNPTAKAQVHTEDLIGFYVTMAIAILGFTGLTIGGISVGNSFAALFIMLVALVGGATIGATGGIGVGIIGILVMFPSTEMLGIYGFCGLASGLMSKYKRAGVILGFTIANSLLSIYFGGFGGSTFSIFELALAVVLLCLTPHSFIIEIENVISSSKSENRNTQKSIDIITQKINTISKSFENLAETFSNVVMPKQPDNLSDITILYDKTADKVCKRCGLKFACWEREFSSTYDSLSKLTPVLVEKGQVEIGDVVNHFSNKCIKIVEFVKELNKTYGQYKIDKMWQMQVQESRELVSDQLYGVSQIISDLATDMNKELVFDTHLENQLYIELEKAGIKCSDITIVKNTDRRYEVSMRVKPCGSVKLCQEKIVPMASQVLGTKMCKKDDTCSNIKGNTRCRLILIEQEKFGVECGSAKCTKNGQIESGDNCTYQQINNGKYAVILSDGMGSGSEAAKQSCTTIELMRHFLNAGFDKNMAGRMINSALFLNSNNECFATVDIAVFDLFETKVEFIKIGANTSYIKSGRKIEKISSTTLPAGILSNVDIEITSKNMQNGDYVIMLSDGVHNACDGWIEDFILNLDIDSPQEISDAIIAEALKRKGNKIDDDMTVITAKICEKGTRCV